MGKEKPSKGLDLQCHKPSHLSCDSSVEIEKREKSLKNLPLTL